MARTPRHAADWLQRLLDGGNFQSMLCTRKVISDAPAGIGLPSETSLFDWQRLSINDRRSRHVSARLRSRQAAVSNAIRKLFGFASSDCSTIRHPVPSGSGEFDARAVRPSAGIPAWPYLMALLPCGPQRSEIQPRIACSLRDLTDESHDHRYAQSGERRALHEQCREWYALRSICKKCQTTKSSLQVPRTRSRNR